VSHTLLARRFVIAVLFSVLCSTFFVSTVSAHTTVHQQRMFGCDPTIDPNCTLQGPLNQQQGQQQQQGCINYLPGQHHNDQTDPPQCPPTNQGNGEDNSHGNPPNPCPVDPHTGLDCHGQPVFVCIGGGSCNGQENGNTGKPLPPNNDQEVGNCLLDLNLKIADVLGGGGAVEVIFNVFQQSNAQVADGQFFVTENRLDALVDFIVSKIEEKTPVGSCLELIPHLRSHVKQLVRQALAHFLKHVKHNKRRH